jgi:two-component system response regulator (stage 0 sporulation protein F)
MDNLPLDDGPPTLRNVPPRGLRVLLAEDDDDVRSLLAALLRRDGHEVIEARDGSELAARTGPGPDGARAYDVVVSDVMMPGATGIVVLSRMANGDSPPPVVVMTAYADREMRAWSRSVGAVAIFAKPFDVDDLRTVLLNLPPRDPRAGAAPLSH